MHVVLHREMAHNDRWRSSAGSTVRDVEQKTRSTIGALPDAVRLVPRYWLGREVCRAWRKSRWRERFE